jgi:small-conductance mechanosensitive channel
VFDGALIRRTRRPARLLFPLIGLHAALPLLNSALAPATLDALRRVLSALSVAAIAWGLVALTHVLDDVVEQRFDISVADNLRARRVRTQVGLLRQVIAIIIVILAFGTVLMQFEGFRALGAGLLASAGVVGIVIGIAAQRPLGNMVAGVQLALTQPIRVGDAVVIEGEWGTIEEITLTYVVVRIWDQRRLVLPILQLFEHSFQNWTRTTAQIIGSVFIHVDYTAPVDAIRAELGRIVRASALWDRQVLALQVTDATDRTMQLRAIMSAANAGHVWDLRCEVREKLVDFLQRAYPEVLPRLRVVELESGREGGAVGGAGSDIHADASTGASP